MARADGHTRTAAAGLSRLNTPLSVAVGTLWKSIQMAPVTIAKQSPRKRQLVPVDDRCRPIKSEFLVA